MLSVAQYCRTLLGDSANYHRGCSHLILMGFYHIAFDDVGEGAGLVAALSRQLASPRVDLRDVGAVEVGIRARAAAADVYLSAGALTAVERAFARPPVVTKVE